MDIFRPRASRILHIHAVVFGQTSKKERSCDDLFSALRALYPYYSLSRGWRTRALILPATDEASRVRTSGIVRERSARVVRGRSSQLQRRGNAVTFSELELLGDAVDGGAVEDEGQPEEGESFYYLAAQSDASGEPLLGFASRCRGRGIDISKKD